MADKNLNSITFPGLPDKYKVAQVADEYSSSSTYEVGDIVNYLGTTYKCTTAITTAENWTVGHWTAVKIADEVTDLKSAIGNKSGLNTDTKTNLVSAINEVNGHFLDGIDTAVENWLDDHPEATTTVQDGSLTLQKFKDRELPFVTPQMFGAKGDGETDDSESFLDCFDGNYNKIFIPQGEYVISEKITIRDDTIVVCEGTIKKSGIFDILFDVGNNCDIQLNIDEDKASSTDFSSQTSADIYINGKTNVRLHDTKIMNIDSRYGMWIEKSSHIVIERCYIDTYVYIAIGCRDGNHDVKVLSNTVLNGHGVQSNRYPIVLNSGGNNDDVSRNIVCDGNYIEDQTPKWEGIDAHGLSNAVISNNTILNTATGIAVVSGGNDITENIVITGNVYRLTKVCDAISSTYGITVAVNSKNVAITNNSLYGCGNNSSTSDKGGIKIYGIDQAIISNNIINCSSGNGVLASSITDNPLNNFKLYNNIINGAVNGIKLENSLSVNITGEIKENIIKNCTVGLNGNESYGTGYDSCVFAKDNEILDCTTNFINAAKGLLVSPSGTTSSGYGRQGMEIDFSAPQDGITKAVCVTSASGSTPAVWKIIYGYFPICGEYELDNGYANVWDTRITANSYAVVTNFYKSSDSPEQFISAVLPNNGRFVVYVRNKDGTNATGTVKLALLVIQYSS